MRNNMRTLLIYSDCVFVNLYKQSISINTFKRKSVKSTRIQFNK